MSARRLLTTISLLLLIGPLTIVLSIASSSQVALATHNSSFCKWDFPWPRSIEYYIRLSSMTPGQFTATEATRVSYGAGTYNGWNFNLYFTRVYDIAQSENYINYGGSYVQKGVLADSRYVAITTITNLTNAGGTSCNRDAGRPIVRAVVTFDTDHYAFNTDCAANYNYCVANGLYDLHDVSANEFGHWV